MANEFKHVSVGTEITQAEYEGTAGHVFNSQATGDIMYASSSSQLTRLGIGSTNAVLTVSGGIPAWDTTWTPAGDLLPSADDTYDIGSASAAWQDLFLEGDITLTDAGTIATSAGALTITSAAAATWGVSSGDLTVDVAGDIVLDADGDDITFKAGSGDTTGLSFTNSSGSWVLKTGTSDADFTIAGNDGGSNVNALVFDMSDTAKATFAGSVVVTGDLTISGDDLFMSTNTDGYVLIADGTNYNPVAVSGDIAITNAGVTSIGSGVIVNADVNGSAAIDVSKTALSAGTGISLSTNTLNVDAAQTGITSIYATDLIMGEDSQTAIDFGRANEIDFKADNAARLTLTSGALYPVTNNEIDLGTSSLEFKDAFFDGTVTADAFAGPLTGNVTGNASGTAATVTGGTQASITTVANVVEVGALDAGSITSGFGAIDNGTSNIRTATITAETAVVPDAASGATLGTTSLEWGHVYIGDDQKIYLGDGQDVSLEYDEDGTDQLRIAGNTVFENQIEATLDIEIDSTPSDETVSGVTATFTAGEDLVRGEVVYFKASDSKMWKAVATASGTSRCVAMAAADISADAAGLFLLQGFLADNGSFPSYTIGGALYTPEAETSGENVPEQTAPDSDGDFVQVLGWAVTANSVYFNPSNDIIEHA